MLGTKATGLMAVIASIWTLAGCGTGVTVSFGRHPRTVHLRVGEEVSVRKSLGECGSPWSTEPSVIAVEHAPRVDDCSQETVKFKAIGLGNAQIHGALPCRATECTAVGAAIPVVVSRA